VTCLLRRKRSLVRLDPWVDADAVARQRHGGNPLRGDGDVYVSPIVRLR
jgi:hypothetical protein